MKTYIAIFTNADKSIDCVKLFGKSAKMVSQNAQRIKDREYPHARSIQVVTEYKFQTM